MWRKTVEKGGTFFDIFFLNFLRTPVMEMTRVQHTYTKVLLQLKLLVLLFCIDNSPTKGAKKRANREIAYENSNITPKKGAK